MKDAASNQKLEVLLWVSMFGPVKYPTPSTEKLLYGFQTENDISRWKVFTDMEFGGKTTASLTLVNEPDVRTPCLFCFSVQ